jgi:hypothetical protein
MVPRDRAKAIFKALDGPPGPEDKKPPEPASTPPTGPDEPAGVEAAPGEEPAAPGQTEEQLPESIRKALKEISDPALRKRLTDDHFRLRHWDKLGSRLGMKVSDLEGYVVKAVQMAPSLDVLEHIGATAGIANQLVSAFNDGSPESFQKFAEAQFRINPTSFVNYVGFLLGKYDTLRDGVRQVDPALAKTLQASVDGLADSRVKNLIGNLRKTSDGETRAGRESVLGEVADELEKYLGWSERGEEPPAPAGPDPRDAELAKFKAERQQQQQRRQRALVGSVYDTAGGQLAPAVSEYVKGLTAGYPPKAIEKIAAQIEDALYDALLSNRHVRDRAVSIHQSGRYDKQHHDRLVSFYIEQGKRLLPLLGEPVIADWKATIGPVRAREAAKVEQYARKRDIGATGAPPPPRVEAPPRGGDPKDIFAHLDRMAERG